MANEVKPRKRAQNSLVRSNRDARRIVAPAQKALDGWQRELAHIRTALALRSTHQHALIERALAVVPLVVAQRVELDQRAAETSSEVASHSLIRDVRRALSRLVDELEVVHEFYGNDDVASIVLQNRVGGAASDHRH